MGKAARKIENEILANLPANKRLFKINSGMGWQGKIVKRTDDVIILKHPRPLHAAPPGWPDLVGFETITVTESMVGQKIAVFCGEEIKAGKDRLTKGQKLFGDLIERMGGMFRVITGNE